MHRGRRISGGCGVAAKAKLPNEILPMRLLGALSNFLIAQKRHVAYFS